MSRFVPAQRVALVVSLAASLTAIANYLVAQATPTPSTRVPNNSFVTITVSAAPGWLTLVIGGGAFVVWAAGSWLILRR